MKEQLSQLVKAKQNNSFQKVARTFNLFYFACFHGPMTFAEDYIERIWEPTDTKKMKCTDKKLMVRARLTPKTFGMTQAERQRSN